MQWNPVVWIDESKQFLLEVRTEFKKVTWPNRKETMAGTIGVLVVVVVLAIVLSLIDVVLGRVIQFFVP